MTGPGSATMDNWVKTTIDFSRNIALYHERQLYDFVMLVRNR
jgi:hypothetical protein